MEHLAAVARLGGRAGRRARLRLFDAVGRFLAAAAAEQPLLVMLDDVCTPPTSPRCCSFAFSVEALADACVLLLRSYRDGESRVRELSRRLCRGLARVGRRLRYGA